MLYIQYLPQNECWCAYQGLLHSLHCCEGYVGALREKKIFQLPVILVEGEIWVGEKVEGEVNHQNG